MNSQHQLHALSGLAAVLVMLLAGCVDAAAAQPATPTTPTSSTSVAPPQSGLGDNQPGCAARAMAQGTFNPACSEYQGYLDPGTAGGRAPTSGEIQRENLCRSGRIPSTEC